MISNLSKDNLDVKTFWKLSKNILGCNSDRSIPPLIENDQVIPDDLSKATVFNNYFASISSFPENIQIPDLPNFNYLTETRLDSVTTNETEVESLLRRVNAHKSSGPDGVGNWVLKHCAKPLSVPYSKLFNKSLQTGRFPTQWKQANVCPVFKKENRSDKTNYRPISLLSSSSKILEKIVYKRLYEYLIDNNLLIEQNSGFKRKDSTVNQLLKFVHQIYQDINSGKDTCLVFLDVSKAFDKVWHKGLLFKLRQLGIAGTLYDWLEHYLTARSQKVVINGISSSLKYLQTGVPQGSILGPLLFLIYINDIINGLQCNVNLFADDTSIQKCLDNYEAFKVINEDLLKLSSCGSQWLISFNALKTEYIIVSKKKTRGSHPDLFLNDTKITEANHHKHLGLIISNTMSWSYHINEILAKAEKRLSIMRRSKHILPRSCLDKLYKSMIRPLLDYCDVIYDSCTMYESQRLDKLQRKASLLCTGAFRITSNEKVLKELGWSKLANRRTNHRLVLFYKILNNLAPQYLKRLCNLTSHNTNNYLLRRNNSFLVPTIHRESFSKSFFPKTIRDWNNLANSIKQSQSLTIFKTKVKSLYEPLVQNKLYCQGHGLSKVNHCRMRLGLSHLNSHLHHYNLIDSPSCSNPECGRTPESAAHYFLSCPRYNNERRVLFESLSRKLFPNVNYNTFIVLMPDHICTILLEGSEDASYEENTSIFDEVFKYIDSTQRFSTFEDMFDTSTDN